MQDFHKRLDAVEERLYRIEQKLGMGKPVPEVAPSMTAAVQRVPEKQPQPQPVVVAATRPVNARQAAPEPVTATQWMAWCAGITFVLAALYFLKLVYDAGWLTPLRQVALAYVGASALVVSGFYLQKKDHHYAAYLPAAGLVVLYLTTFMAHLYYHLMPAGMATGTVGLITLLGIWLGRHFEQSAYVIFSALGVYVSPLLVHAHNSELLDLVVYYSAWSLLFSFCAISEQRRVTYLLPMYLAILGFDLVFRLSGDGQWALAAIYQLVQFLIFGVTTVAYSVHHQEPLTRDQALPHGLALFLFYAIEYALLQQHIPDWVNYWALASGAVVYVLYGLASRYYQGEESLKAGAVLVSYYCSWVAVHALFFGELDQNWLPWAVLCTPILFMLLADTLKDNAEALTPVMLACGGLFVLGYAMLLGNLLLDVQLDTPQPTLALFVYVLLLYGIYYQLSRRPEPLPAAALMLYAGHLAFIACLVDWVIRDIYLSALWAVYGVGLLLVALAIKDKILGKSALLVFSAAAFKVLLFDLSGSNSLTRVIVLLVISASLYAGGWLYQSLVRGKP